MKPEEIEKQIADAPDQALPSEWRSEILATACAALADTPPPSFRETGLPLWIWRELIAPLRHGWIALAALWILLISAQFLASVDSNPIDSNTNPRLSSLEFERGFNEHRQLLVELLDNRQQENPIRSDNQKSAPRPRS